ncbi:DUF1028 domain-containing protein [Ktedonobacter racemifer]|uniref:Putative peptidoglycan binding domain-containing protein n=1 Tax=Ktedonobacter racemifer DSM 44963 TaxID=485913 RepID=D6TMT2_KTERA|nr:DUF1028 domain-containing protein [Ktedonobacter racemifer]EFH87082.1 protein of unknown function DUF1028 [Ktedonobacter racemifer DSM 44963]
MTYSIVARDPERGELGIAVQSKFLSVGAVVPWAKAGIGAIATQALANTGYGIQGLNHLAAGRSAQETLKHLLASDEGRADRQVGIIGMTGQPVSFTGERCFHWAGGLTGEHYACQGNILVSGDTVEAMARTFEETGGLLCDRLLAALAAGQAAGGDGRGQQSAALLVVKEGAGYGGYTDRFIDLRVDDHPTPIDELKRILELHKLYLFRPDPADILTIDASLAQELQKLLTITGDYQSPITSRYDEPTREAFRAFSGRENLEERWFEDARIDRVVLEFLRQKVADHKAH